MRNLIRIIAAALLLATLPLTGSAAVFVSVAIAPPVLPVYVAPPMPEPGYFWVPGYWAWDGDEYYWVPGTWVLAPEVGLLWTPGYWGWGGGLYVWHAGYWGPHVGFYGGINYGFGYDGVGYGGGVWRDRTFVANTTVINNTTVVNNTTVINRVSYNGGTGGVRASPSEAQMQAAHERHVDMSSAQREHQQAASRDNTMRASFNHGRPPVAATQKAGVFYGKGVVAARAAGGAATPARTGGGAGASPTPSEPHAATHAPAAHAPATHSPATHAPATHAPAGGSPGGGSQQPHAPHAGNPAPSGYQHQGGGYPRPQSQGAPSRGNPANAPHGGERPERDHGGDRNGRR